MPVNAPMEYYKAEDRFRTAKSKDEKILALEEMIRLLPKHHGSEAALAQLKSRLAKLRKEAASGKKGGGRATAIAKEGDAQVCIVGLTNSGKSFLLKALTSAQPEVASHPYTTTKPEVGMMDYNGIKVQLIEIPSIFLPEHMSIARTADRVLLIVRGDEDKSKLLQVLESSFIHTKRIFASPWSEPVEDIKEKVWKSLGMIIVYSRRKQPGARGVSATPMALSRGSTVHDFALRIHKDFIRNFRFARILRRGRQLQAGLEYRLEEGDIVEIYAK